LSDSTNPAVDRRRLATELRRLRVAAQLTITEVAERIECSPGKVSRIETGAVGVQLGDVRDLLKLYRVHGAERERLLELARRSRRRGWWRDFASILPPESARLFGLEDGASNIDEYSCGLVPGLLQAEGYASALIATAKGGPDVAARRTQLRLHRQKLLTRHDPPPPRLHVVVHEAALVAQVGGACTMFEQLARLTEASRLPNVTLQVLPLTTGAHASAGVSFTIFSFAHVEDLPIVHLEQLTSSTFRENAKDVAVYREAFNEVAMLALDPGASQRVLSEHAAKLEGAGTPRT
jgi:transcriptional regulator with XRE-family HTH domain